MAYDFVWSSPSSGAPIISIAKYGITFNSASIDLLNKPAKIQIGYDNNEKVIGVKPAENSQQNAFTFAEKDKKGYIRIGNIDFVKYVANKAGIDITKTTRYAAEWNDIEGALIIDLKKPIDNIDTNEDEDESEE